MRSDTRRLFSRFSYMGLFVALFVVLGNALISPTTRVYAEPAPTTTTVEEETTTTTTSTTTTTFTTFTTDPPYSQVPDAPTDISVAIMSDSSAVVSFVAPTFEGSSDVFNYVIRTNSDPSTDRDIDPTDSHSGVFSKDVYFPPGSPVLFAVSAENEAGSSGWTESSSFSWDNTNPQVPTVVLVDPQADSVSFPQMHMYGPTYMTICVVPDIDLRFNGVDTSPINPFAIEPGTASSVIAELNGIDGLELTAAAFYSSQKLSRPSNVVISAYAVSDPTDNSTLYCNGSSGAPFFEASVEIRPLNIGLRRRQVAVALHRTCVTGGECRLGDTGPGGGTIFYVDLNRQVGSQYFEAACVGWQNSCDDTTPDPTAEWGCYRAPIFGADGTAIGTGEQNTTKIVADCSDTGIAAKVADDLTLGGQSDWFLPSQDELNALCKWAFGDTMNAICNNDGNDSLFLTGVGGFSTVPYWSSSEDVRNMGFYYDNNGWFQSFGNGNQYATMKDFPFSMRPVRSF